MSFDDSRLWHVLRAERHSRQPTAAITEKQVAFLARLDAELGWGERSYDRLSRAEAQAAIDLRLRHRDRK